MVLFVILAIFNTCPRHHCCVTDVQEGSLLSGFVASVTPDAVFVRFFGKVSTPPNSLSPDAPRFRISYLHILQLPPPPPYLTDGHCVSSPPHVAGDRKGRPLPALRYLRQRPQEGLQGGTEYQGAGEGARGRGVGGGGSGGGGESAITTVPHSNHHPRLSRSTRTRSASASLSSPPSCVPGPRTPPFSRGCSRT